MAMMLNITRYPEVELKFVHNKQRFIGKVVSVYGEAGDNGVTFEIDATPVPVDKETEPKKKKYYNGKVVCTKYDTLIALNNDLTVGKVYDILDGALIDNNGHYYFRRPAKSFDDLIRLAMEEDCGHIDFVEFKGEA